MISSFCYCIFECYILLCYFNCTFDNTNGNVIGTRYKSSTIWGQYRGSILMNNYSGTQGDDHQVINLKAFGIVEALSIR